MAYLNLIPPLHKERLKKEQLFYLKSRGLSEKQAKNLIIKGFFEPLLRKIEIDNIKKEVRNIVEEKI